MHFNQLQLVADSARNYTVEDLINVHSHAFSSLDDLDWFATCSIGIFAWNTNATFTNCSSERCDVALLAASSTCLTLNGWYSELNYKSSIISYAANVIVNGGFGTNEKFIFADEQWEDRYYNYAIVSRGKIILNNAQGGSFSAINVNNINDNHRIFNAKLFQINCDNLDFQGFPYMRNHEIIDFVTLPDTIFIDDNVEDDSTNWGFSRSYPIKFSTLIERMSLNFDSNIYKRKKYNVRLLSDVTLHNVGYLYNCELYFLPYNESKNVTMYLRRGISAFNSKLHFRYINFVNTGSVSALFNINETIYDFPVNNYMFRNCVFDDSIASIFNVSYNVAHNIGITNCVINSAVNLIQSSYSVDNGFTNFPITIYSRNNVDESGESKFCESDRYGANSYYTNLIKRQYFNIEDLPSEGLQDSDTLQRVYVTNSKKTYKYNGNKWIEESPRGSTTNRPSNYSQTEMGEIYFDTTLNKPIWWTGFHWVDATGAEV